MNRGGLTAMLKTFARNAIEHDDQTYGRQLATICEQVAASLRLKFGGKTLLLQSPKRKVAAPPSAAVAAPLTPGELWERDLAAFRISAASQSPYSVEAGDAMAALGLRERERGKYMRAVDEARRNGGILNVGNGVVIAAWPEGHPRYVPVDNIQTGVGQSSQEV